MTSQIDPAFQLRKYLKADWRANSGNPRALTLLTLYRIAHWASLARKENRLGWLYASPYLVLYRFITEFCLSSEIQAATRIGPGLIIDHGYSIVINKNAVLGAKCRLRHGVTIGCNVRSDGSQGPSPIIGDGVEFGANASVVGGITLGDGVRVAANSLVLSNVSMGATVVGVPAQVTKSRVIPTSKSSSE